MLKYVVGKIAKGIAAGVMISIGCAVYLACENKIAGAVLFSVALLSICFLELSLYTGKIGFIVEKYGKEEFSELFLGLLGNLIGTVVCGVAIRIALPSLAETAAAMCAVKLGQAFYQTLIRGIFCGVLMYVAVAVFKEKKSPLGVIFAIPVFILSGFEHSIADIGYFAVAWNVSWQSFGFIWAVILGNSVGAMILPLLKKLYTKKPADAVDAVTEKKDENC